MVAQKPQGIGQGLPLDNEQIARRLDEVAELLDAQAPTSTGSVDETRSKCHSSIETPAYLNQLLAGIGASLGRSIGG